MSGDLTVAGALGEAKAARLDRLDAQLLLGHVLAQSRAWLIAHDAVLLRQRFCNVIPSPPTLMDQPHA